MSDPLVINGRYEVLETIGSGGMGVLYRARDPWIGGRIVALKLLRREIDDDEVRQRFRQEASAAGILEHESIVRIFDVGEHEGHPFIAMEFVDGETLSALIKRDEPIPLRTKLIWTEQLCDALAFAHAHGIVHRDIKPLNLIIERRRQLLKVLDFGIAKVADSGLTSAGMMIGTVNYMSPEQMRGERVDHRSDIFSVGATVYELLVGRRAFPGTLTDGVMGKILTQPAPSVLAVAPHLPPQLDVILGRALEKDPASRYPDLTVMRDEVRALREWLEQTDPNVRVALPHSSAGLTLPAGATPLPSGVTAPAAPLPTASTPAIPPPLPPATGAAPMTTAPSGLGAAAAPASGGPVGAAAPATVPAPPTGEVTALPAPASPSAARLGAFVGIAFAALLVVAGLGWWLVPWDTVLRPWRQGGASPAADREAAVEATPAPAPSAEDREAAVAAARLRALPVVIDVQPWAEARIIPALTDAEVAALPPSVVRELARERGPFTTPFTVELPAGDYVVFFENDELGVTHTERITVADGQANRFRFRMSGFDADRAIADLLRRAGP